MKQLRYLFLLVGSSVYYSSAGDIVLPDDFLTGIGEPVTVIADVASLVGDTVKTEIKTHPALYAGIASGLVGTAAAGAVLYGLRKDGENPRLTTAQRAVQSALARHGETQHSYFFGDSSKETRSVVTDIVRQHGLTDTEALRVFDEPYALSLRDKVMIARQAVGVGTLAGSFTSALTWVYSRVRGQEQEVARLCAAVADTSVLVDRVHEGALSVRQSAKEEQRRLTLLGADIEMAQDELRDALLKLNSLQCGTADRERTDKQLATLLATAEGNEQLLTRIAQDLSQTGQISDELAETVQHLVRSGEITETLEAIESEVGMAQRE